MQMLALISQCYITCLWKYKLKTSSSHTNECLLFCFFFFSLLFFCSLLYRNLRKVWICQSPPCRSIQNDFLQWGVLAVLSVFELEFVKSGGIVFIFGGSMHFHAKPRRDKQQLQLFSEKMQRIILKNNIKNPLHKTLACTHCSTKHP